jgi:hypothetical protein
LGPQGPAPGLVCMFGQAGVGPFEVITVTVRHPLVPSASSFRGVCGQHLPGRWCVPAGCAVRQNLPVSFDIYLQGFRDGEARDADPELLEELLKPHIADRSDGFARLRFADGQADIYGMDDLASGVMVNRVSGVMAMDLIVRLARRAELAILPVGCPTAVTREDLLKDLPEELAEDAVVVTTGEHMLRLIEDS